MGKQYCEAVGCESKIGDKNISFFKLPKDEKRRNQWLQEIDRTDLVKSDTKPESHVVCSQHFAKNMIIHRPLLKPDAVPSILISNQTNEQETQTDEYCIKILSVTSAYNEYTDVQTASENISTETTQPSVGLSSNTPTKRKLYTEFNETDDKRIKLEKELQKIKTEVQSAILENFSFNSEDVVTERFRKLVAWQSKLEMKKGNRFDPEFKLFALNLHFASPQSYRCLKSFLHLPSESTLERFKMVIPPKFENRVLDFLASKLKSMPENAKYCTLCIGEMALKRHLYYDTKSDQIIGFHNINGKETNEIASNACAVMLQGIIVNWKQPLAYSFMASPQDYKDLENWLEDIITKLSTIGIEVMAVVSDQSSNFDKYASEVKKVTAEKPYFLLNEKKMYYIFDVPDLLKCVRNNLLTNNFILEGKTISWEYIESLYKKRNAHNLKLIPEVTDKHIRPNKIQKMRVKYAAQIFSRSVYAALNVLIFDKTLPEEAKPTAGFVETMNNLFDVLNSSKINATNKFQRPFSMKNYQSDVLEEGLSLFKNLSAIDIEKGSNSTNQIKALQNLQISIQAIICLSKDLQGRGFKSIFTRRLNQDCLENVFGSIRQQGGNCRDPTPIQFMRAFSKVFLCSMLKRSRYSNCGDDVCDLLTKANTYSERWKQERLSTPQTPSAINLHCETDYRFDLPAQNALSYVSGYLLHKCSKKHACHDFNAQLKKTQNLSETSMYSHFKAYNTTTSFYGRLKDSPESFTNYIRDLETLFLTNFESDVSHRPGSSIYEKLKKFKFEPLCSCFPDEYLLKLFVRFRIFSTLKFNNRELRDGQQFRKYIKIKPL